MMALLPMGNGHVFSEGVHSSPYQANLWLNRPLPITSTYRYFCGPEPSASPVTQLPYVSVLALSVSSLFTARWMPLNPQCC